MDGMGIFWTVVIGGIAGMIAKVIMGGREFSGFFITVALGIAGSVVATFLGQSLGWYGPNQGARFIGSIVGAVVILAVYRMFARPRTY